MATTQTHDNNNDDNNNMNLVDKSPILVSSTSSLDSFLVGLTPSSSLAMLNDVADGEETEQQLGDAIPSTTHASMLPSLFAGQTSFMRATAAASLAVSNLPLSNGSLLMAVTNNDNILQPGGAAGNSVPEFLYQLTRMLTDENKEIIEWSNGRIEVHNPHKLESQVLQNYFRHSKFASFQRQLNYFNFRKLAGKGKMAPCSYVNPTVTDLSGLLVVKRKTPTSTTCGKEKGSANTNSSTGGSSKAKASRKRLDAPSSNKTATSVTAINPVLADILHRSVRQSSESLLSHSSNSAAANSSSGSLAVLSAGVLPKSQLELARSAVGKGIRFSCYAPVNNPLEGTNRATVAAALNEASSGQEQLPQECLSQLESNFRNSLQQDMTEKLSTPTPDLADTDPTPLSEMQACTASPYDTGGFTGFLRPNSSLVDLAMIPMAEGTDQGDGADNNSLDGGGGLTFVDFPYPEVFPATIGTHLQGSADSFHINDDGV